jgi:hypothetical protein
MVKYELWGLRPVFLSHLHFLPVTLGQLLYFSVSQFSHLSNGRNKVPVS